MFGMVKENFFPAQIIWYIHPIYLPKPRTFSTSSSPGKGLMWNVAKPIYTKINKYRSPTTTQTEKSAPQSIFLLSVLAVIQSKKPILLRSGFVVMEFAVIVLGRKRIL